MGIRQEAEEEIKKEEKVKKSRRMKVKILEKFCSEKDIPFSEEDKDKILNPEDYDDWGWRRRFTN